MKVHRVVATSLVLLVSACGATASSLTETSSSMSVAAHRCVVEMTRPDGTSLTVPGWGAAQLDAANAARETAHYLAEAEHATDAWPLLLGVPGALLEPGGAWEAWQRVSSRSAALVPGYEVGQPSCAPERDAPSPTGWRVRWGAVEAAGGELGATLERARRHGCGRPFGSARRAALVALGEQGPERGMAAFKRALGDARDALAVCLVAEGDASRAPASLQPSAQPSAARGVVCVGASIDSSREPGFRTPVVLATSAEGAREGAWRAWRGVTHRRAIADAMDARASAHPSMALSMIARAFESGSRDVGVSMAYEGVLTPCGAIPEQTELAWSWSVERAPDCRSGSTLSFESASFSDASNARARLCDQASDVSGPDISEALDAAAPEQRERLFLNGWSISLGCQSLCMGGASLPVELTWPAVGVESESDLMPAVMEALESRDLDALLGMVPLFGSSRAVEATERAPERFYNGLREVLEKGSPKFRMQPELFHGRWVLMPSGS